MKIITDKKNIIINLIILISLVLTIYLNCTVFIINYEFNYSLFALSIIICLICYFLLSIKLETSNKVSFIVSIISFILSILFSYIIVELLNQNLLLLFNLPIKRIVFNFIIIIFIHLFIYALSNKINLTIIISNSIIFILGLVNYIIVCFRDSPFVPWDILSLKTAATVAGNYTFKFTHHLLLAIVLFVLVISISLKATYKFKKSKANSILRFSFLILIVVLTITFYTTNVIYYFDLDTNLWEPQNEYMLNGFLASFIKQSKNLFVAEPDNYSIESVESIVSNYNNESSQTNSDSPNIIVIMNETFSDLKVNGNFNTSQEYMPYFNSLEENTIKGNAYVSILGGSTPNSEWEFLTNNTMGLMPHNTIPYQQYIKTPSYSLATTLEAQGYTTSAIHPWYGAGYRRNAVYPLLGFDSFESIETLDNLKYIRTFPSDLSTYKTIIKQFENKDENEKIFNFTLTMQNHSGYDFENFNSSVLLTDIANCPRVEQYLSLMKESDSALEYLINYFKSYDEKTIILLFGDHQPSYLEEDFWQNIMEDPTDMTSRYITPFMLWANYDIEESYIEKISLNYLSILLLDVAELQTTPYMNFLKDVQKELPVITGNGYIDNNGNYYTFEDNKYSEILNKYQIVQYNNVFDYTNTVNSFFEIR